MEALGFEGGPEAFHCSVVVLAWSDVDSSEMTFTFVGSTRLTSVPRPKMTRFVGIKSALFR